MQGWRGRKKEEKKQKKKLPIHWGVYPGLKRVQMLEYYACRLVPGVRQIFFFFVLLGENAPPTHGLKFFPPLPSFLPFILSSPHTPPPISPPDAFNPPMNSMAKVCSPSLPDAPPPYPREAERGKIIIVCSSVHQGGSEGLLQLTFLVMRGRRFTAWATGYVYFFYILLLAPFAYHSYIYLRPNHLNAGLWCL